MLMLKDLLAERNRVEAELKEAANTPPSNGEMEATLQQKMRRLRKRLVVLHGLARVARASNE